MMKFERLFPFLMTSELLVCETDGFSLSGAVLARAGSHVDVRHQAKVKQVDMNEALADLVEQLKADGWRGGGSAILLSPAVLSTPVELPVNPKKPRPLAQMTALVQGEAEALLMQHMTRWSAGYLLVGRGYMTEEQVEAVMDLQQGKPNAAGGLALSDHYSFRRFGELAEELGYIKRSQLNACLTAQQWLKSDDEVIECNWAPQGEVEDIPGTYQWLVSCISQSLLQRWVDVFAKQSVKLTAIYPLSGCATALLPNSSSSELILEVHPGMVLATRLNAGRIHSQQVSLHVNDDALRLCLEAYHAMQGSANEKVWLSSWQGRPQALADELRENLAVEVNVVNDPAISDKVTPGMIGAAHQDLSIADPGRCIGVREGGPLPPLKERLSVRAAALAAFLLIVITGMEISLWLQHREAASIEQELDARWQSIDQASKRISAQNKKIKQRKQDLKKQQAEQQRLQARLDFYNRAIPERTGLVKAVLGVLQNSVSDEVVVNRLYEADRKMPGMPTPPGSGKKAAKVEVESFTLEAWALSEAAAQTFIQKIQQEVEPWRLEVRDTRVYSGAGPLNLQGFGVTMRVVKLRSVVDLQAQGKMG